MIYEFNSLQEFLKAAEENPCLMGSSPGGVRSSLGITRQAVFSAVKRGELDEVRITDPLIGQTIIFITSDSVQRFRNKPAVKGRPPKAIQLLKHEYDRWSGYWPSDK